ncbi:hypothetical protein ADL22_00400 [Streptomyces sp. NRRL F-4489]|nr:hypothetical protein ADL22_00400 [Streptomyces sp. NRRL F-4489]
MPPPVTGTDTARADVRTGNLSATRYITSGENNSYAMISVWLTPLADRLLNVMPYVNWNGYAKVQTRVFDPHVDEQQPAASGGYLGIIVGSVDASGHYTLQARKWVPLWEIGGLNPNQTQSYTATAHGGDFVLPFQARANQRYDISVACTVHVQGKQGFAVETLADSEFWCTMPQLQVFS